MNTKVIILAAGKGSKLAPYTRIRSKTTLKIAGKPLIRYNVEAAIELGCNEIIVVANSKHLRVIKESLLDISNIKYICDDSEMGTAESFEVGLEILSKQDNCIVLYGDTIVSKNDLKLLFHSNKSTVLLSELRETSRNWIGASIENGYISSIGAHYRGDSITHQFAGFCFHEDLIEYVKNAPDYFPMVKVGVGVPRERYIEAGLVKALEYLKISAITCNEYFLDIDKPWQMLEANHFMVEYLCGSLNSTVLLEGARISEKADIKGFVKLGKNSYIGDRVVVDGNLIVGDNTIIDNGAIFKGSAVIGDNTKISNYCIVYDGCSVGSNCVLDHCAEFLGGIIMDRVYLYHYGEFYGAIGSYTDIGAATVCGTLRFDDGETMHSIKGRKEIPLNFSNAAYIGDYCRTGVNTIIMPGCKIGAYSVIGAGVIVNEDIEENSLVYAKQELVVKKWSADKYGW